MMPDGIIINGPYSRPPSATDERIKLALDRFRPEEIPGLIWTKPDFSSLDHRIITKFSIDRKKRPGQTFVPCAMCSGHRPKFLDGAVLWSPDQWLRVIGHVCARKPEHFGEANYRRLTDQLKQQFLDELALNWLQGNVSAFPLLRKTIILLKKVALFIEVQRMILFKDVPTLAASLETTVKRNFGKLTFDREVPGSRLVGGELGSSGRSEVQYEEVVAGNLLGGRLVARPKKKMSDRLEDCLQALSTVPEGDEEKPLLLLMERGEVGITMAAGVSLRALKIAEQIAGECADAIKFFESDNFLTLEAWGTNKNNPICFSIQRTANHVIIGLSDRSRARVPIDAPPFPDISGLTKILAAGIDLDRALPKAGGIQEPL